MPKKPIEMEVFRSGTHTCSRGNEHTITNDDLDRMVQNYSSENKAPATIGHEIVGKPSYGWFDKFYRKGDSLFATLGDRVEEFETMIKKKMFSNRSLSFNKATGQINHVAFLGATRPAVAGLGDIEFSESPDDLNIEFESFKKKFAFQTIANFFQNIREKMIEEKGVEKADKIVSQFGIDEIRDAGNDPVEEKIVPAFSQPTIQTEDPKMDELAIATAKIKELEASNAEFSTKIEEQGEEIETLKSEKEQVIADFSKYKEEQRDAEFSSFLDDAIDAGKMLPANKDANLAILKSLDSNAKVEFSQGEEKKEVSTLEAFKTQIMAAENVLEFSEVATGENAPQTGDANVKFSQEVQKRANEKNISFSEASQEIRNENPKLANLVEIEAKAS